MNQYILIALILTTGCVGWTAHDALTHSVPVPPGCRKDSIHYLDISDYDHFIAGYECGWNAYIDKCAKDINHEFSKEDSGSCGWWAEINGFYAGTHDAADRVKQLIQRYGKKKTARLLNNEIRKHNRPEQAGPPYAPQAARR